MPDYTTKDLFSYGGFIVGISVFMLSTQAWDAHRLIKLLCGAAVGLLVGYIATTMYQGMNKPFDDSDEV